MGAIPLEKKTKVAGEAVGFVGFRATADQHLDRSGERGHRLWRVGGYSPPHVLLPDAEGREYPIQYSVFSLPSQDSVHLHLRFAEVD